MASSASIQQTINMHTVAGCAEEASEATAEALRSGLSADYLLDIVLLPALAEAARLQLAGEYFVPEMILAQQAAHSVLDVLKPLLNEAHVLTVKRSDHSPQATARRLLRMMLNNQPVSPADVGIRSIAAHETLVDDACNILNRYDQVIGINVEN